MTFEELQKANGLIKTMDIQGKEYGTVPERIKAFRSLYPEGMILTEIISHENGVIVMKATVYTSDGKVLGTGHACEKEGSSFINKGSYVENCESSAVGRAIGMIGLTGAEAAIASAEEVQNAILNQSAQPTAQEYKPEPDEDLPWTMTEAKPVCQDCGKVIEARKTRKGDMWQPDSIAEYTLRKFGRKLCVDCMKAAEK